MEMPQSEDRPDGRPERARQERARDARTGSDAAEARIRNQTHWVDLQVKRAMERGEFDNLPGKGKPLGDLGSLDDRDWWLKKLIERERITGVLPAALQLRKDDNELDALLDREATEKLVREQVEDFNRRIIEARRQLQGGPPVVTPTRDVDAEVERWRERRRERHLRRRTDAEQQQSDGPARARSRRRWFRRTPPD
jgi:DnaJ-like protein